MRHGDSVIKPYPLAMLIYKIGISQGIKPGDGIWDKDTGDVAYSVHFRSSLSLVVVKIPGEAESKDHSIVVYHNAQSKDVSYVHWKFYISVPVYFF